MNLPEKYNPLENQGGFTLLSAMIFLVLLTVIGFAAINTATIETMISGSEKSRQRAFFAAEAGIEHGKIVVMDALKKDFDGETNWKWEDVVLPDPESGKEYKDWFSNNMDSVTYTITTRDNEDDTDTIFYLTSIATLTDGTTAGVEISLSSKLDGGSATGYAAQAGSGSGKSYKSDDANTMTDFTPQTSIDMN